MVGASDTSVAFLESLVFNPHLCFTNLTLVSPHSFYLPSPPPSSSPLDKPPSASLLPEWPVTTDSLCFSREDYSLLGLSTWVNTIKQKMVSINRWVVKIVWVHDEVVWVGGENGILVSINGWVVKMVPIINGWVVKMVSINRWVM